MKPAHIRLKPAAKYSCNPCNWRTIYVIENNDLLAAAAPLSGTRWHVTVFRPKQGEGAESYKDSFRLRPGETWEHVAHNLLTEAGWYSPWEAIP